MSATKTGENVNMKKIVLSTLVALSIATVASASDVKLYQDANGQVFTSAADGRTEISTPSTGVSVNSMTQNLDFSMLAYLGYVNTDNRVKTTTDTNKFEARRMYLQFKAHVLEDPKSYFRLTYDVYDTGKVDTTGATFAGDNYTAQVKYAYLFLNDILPFTDVEIGQAHTTLLDYEESHSWAYRSIDNVFTEQLNAGIQNASAGRGIDLKTNTKFFSSELGVYNNNGYRAAETTYNHNGMGMDYEGRLTLHALGTGTDYKQDHTYFDVSLLGKHNVNGIAGTITKTNGADVDYIGVHSVFNTKPLLVAAQYISARNTATGNDVTSTSGSGYSINFDARTGEKDQYHVFGRYDSWTPKVITNDVEKAKRTYIAGLAWDMNKNVQWVANVITTDNQAGVSAVAYHHSDLSTGNGNAYMLTAQVQF